MRNSDGLSYGDISRNCGGIILCSSFVKRRTTSPGLKPGGRLVNARTLARGRSASDRLRSENATYDSYIDHIIHLAIDNQTQYFTYDLI